MLRFDPPPGQALPRRDWPTAQVSRCGRLTDDARCSGSGGGSGSSSGGSSGAAVDLCEWTTDIFGVVPVDPTCWCYTGLRADGSSERVVSDPSKCGPLNR